MSNLCFAALAAPTLAFAATDEDHPRTLEEVRTRHDWPLWKAAMNAEFAQLRRLGTFELTSLPPDRKAVGCRWVFAIKRDGAGTIVKYKARLVAQGFSQIPGQDFTATHSLVMQLESFRTLVALAAHL